MMERIDTAPIQAGPADIPSLAPLAALPELLEAVRSGQRTQQDVDALVVSLAGPVAEEEKRARADMLLGLLEDPVLGPLTNSQGQRVRTAAFEGLTALGYPYALEVPPAVLARLRREQPVHLSLTARVGLGLAGLAFLLPTLMMLLTFGWTEETPQLLGLFALFLLGPAGLEVLGLKSHNRTLQALGNFIHGFIGVMCLLSSMVPRWSDEGQPLVLLFLSMGLSLLVSAFFLRYRSDDFPLEDE